MLLWKQCQSPAGNNETTTPRAGNNATASRAAHLSSEMEKSPMIDSTLNILNIRILSRAPKLRDGEVADDGALRIHHRHRAAARGGRGRAGSGLMYLSSISASLVSAPQTNVTQSAKQPSNQCPSLPPPDVLLLHEHHGVQCRGLGPHLRAHSTARNAGRCGSGGLARCASLSGKPFKRSRELSRDRPCQQQPHCPVPHRTTNDQPR